MTTLRNLQPGVRVTFADATATTSTGEPGVATGVVNGRPLTDPTNGVVLAVPVFAARDDGREPTTIYVHPDNIVGPAEPHSAP